MTKRPSMSEADKAMLRESYGNGPLPWKQQYLPVLVVAAIAILVIVRYVSRL